MTTALAGPIEPAETAECLSLLDGAGHLLIAVSGGPDSMALLALVAEWAGSKRLPRPAVATVDHGLREGSAAEAAAVSRIAQGHGLCHTTLAWHGEHPASGLQAAARTARYGLLAGHAARIGADAIVTAHHADDQAETVLMRLAAGSGVGGLAGMRHESSVSGVRLLRPLLRITKARLIATCAARGLVFFDDPSNQDPAFTRARLRQVLPLLAAEGVSTRRLLRLADRAARADDALEAATTGLFASIASADGAGLDLAWRCTMAPAEIRLRVLGRCLRHFGDQGGSEADGGAAMPRLERLERLLAALDGAEAAGSPLRRTLGGLIFDLGDARLRVSRAPPRRGRSA